MSNNKQLYSYILGIYNYEQFLENIYKKSGLFNTKEFQGFLIKLSDYENFKKSICYEKFLQINGNSINFSKCEFGNLIIRYRLLISNIKKIEQVKVSTPEELINSIKKGDKYKIIDKNLCELICLKDPLFSYNYSYFVNNNSLKFLNVSFLHNNNNLDEFSYAVKNDEKLNKKLQSLSDSIIEYYNLENQFIGNFQIQTNQKKELNFIYEMKINELRNKQHDFPKKRNMSYDKYAKNYFSEKPKICNVEKIDKNLEKSGEGFLVNKNWITQWKKYTDYNKLIDRDSPTNEKKQEIMKILYNSQKSDNKKNELSPINAIHFNSKSEYENYLKHNDLVIITIKFYNCFEEKETNYDYKIKYSFDNGIITIDLNEIKIDFISIKNTIVKKTNADLIILKEINKFQEESKHLKSNFYKIGIVEKNWMQELKNKYLYSKYSSKQKKFDIIQMSQSKEFIERIKEMEEKNEFDIKSKEKIKIMDKNINEKQLKYISEFEIVNMKTISYLKIIYNDFSNYYCEGEYYMAKTQYSNIIISFQDSEGNYHYHIGKVDENNIFNVNYIFNFNTSYNSSDLLKNILLKKEEEFFNKIYYYRTNNEFIVNDNIKCNFYKLNFNDELDCLKNLFFAINEFENLFKKEVSKKERIYTHEDCYLINKKCLNEFKDIFLYNNYINDKNIFINNKQKIFDIFSDKSKYEKIFDKENDLKNDIYLTIKNVKYFYPYDFNIINNEIFNRLNDFTKFLDTNLSKNLFNKTPLIINDKKIIINIMHYEILVIKIDENNELISEMIIAFDKNDIRETFFKELKTYKFKEMIFDELISFIYDENDNIIGNLYLINDKESKNYIKEPKINSEENIKNYLEIILEFYRLNKYIKDKKRKKITITPSINEEELFIANKKWYDEFRYIFSYDEILSELKKNKDMISEEKEKEKIIKSIYNMISEQSKQFLNNINNNIIQTKFHNKNLYEISKKKYGIDGNKYLKYFSYCLIINKKILDLLKVNYKVHKVKCIFGDDKILIKKDTLIKIGILQNNLFITEYIICSENEEISTQLKNLNINERI